MTVKAVKAVKGEAGESMRRESEREAIKLHSSVMGTQVNPTLLTFLHHTPCPMLDDNTSDRPARRSKRLRREEPDESLPGTKRRRKGNAQKGPGFFNNSTGFVVNEPKFIENRGKIINNFVAGTGPGPMLKRIMECADLDALVDSSARFPPPTCHPKTRLKIGDKLSTWLDNLNRQWNLTWLTGPAATGKSAVAQRLAEHCAEKGRLGASFFFSRPNHRNNPNTVIPTLVYQLAVSHAPYKALVMAQLANDPAILRKARHVQFQKLIVEPFSQLQAQKQQRLREPLLMVLDGLDECNGVDAQREIVEMIGEVARPRKDLPLVWLICSRPEPHLKSLFLGPDFTAHCGREELVIDAESIAEVAFYLRDGLTKMKADFPHVTTPTWPPDDKIVELSEKASGHFGFASISLRYIGDRASSSPMRRLDYLLSFLAGVKVGTSNPLEALDALYTAILKDIPNDILPITMRILGFRIFVSPTNGFQQVQGLCNFFHIDQATFYNAFQNLHSVIDIPPPESALKGKLQFYHASFQDYLRDPSRSGKFAIKEDDVWLDYAKLCFSWSETDLVPFLATDGPVFNKSHEHGILPGLSWVSDDDSTEISYLVKSVGFECWHAFRYAEKWDETLLSQIRNFDFRHIQTDAFDEDWHSFMNKLWEVGSSSGIIRTAPRSEVDLRLVEYMKSMVGLLWDSTPATFPLGEYSNDGEYFFIGYEYKAIICWGGSSEEEVWYSTWNFDKPPTKEEINAYQAGVEDCEWLYEEEYKCDV